MYTYKTHSLTHLLARSFVRTFGRSVYVAQKNPYEMVMNAGVCVIYLHHFQRLNLMLKLRAHRFIRYSRQLCRLIESDGFAKGTLSTQAGTKIKRNETSIYKLQSVFPIPSSSSCICHSTEHRPLSHIIIVSISHTCSMHVHFKILQFDCTHPIRHRNEY